MSEPNDQQTPERPAQIFVAEQTTTYIRLYWHAVADATSYVLEKTRDYTDTNSFSLVYSGPRNAVEDNNVQSSAAYYYRVKAVNATGESNWSPLLIVAASGVPRVRFMFPLGQCSCDWWIQYIEEPTQENSILLTADEIGYITEGLV